MANNTGNPAEKATRVSGSHSDWSYRGYVLLLVGYANGGAFWKVCKDCSNVDGGGEFKTKRAAKFFVDSILDA